MTIDDLEPYFLALIEALQQLGNDNAALLQQVYVLKSVLAIIVFMMGFIAGLLFMRIFWERFK